MGLRAGQEGRGSVLQRVLFMPYCPLERSHTLTSGVSAWRHVLCPLVFRALDSRELGLDISQRR